VAAERPASLRTAIRQARPGPGLVGPGTVPPIGAFSAPLKSVLYSPLLVWYRARLFPSAAMAWKGA